MVPGRSMRGSKPASRRVRSAAAAACVGGSISASSRNSVPEAAVAGSSRSTCTSRRSSVKDSVRDGEEFLHRVPIAGFSSGRSPLLGAPEVLDLAMNRVAPAVGFGAVEMSGGLPPFAWYFDNEGGTLSDPDRVARRQTSMARGTRESYVSDDGYEVEIDLQVARVVG